MTMPLIKLLMNLSASEMIIIDVISLMVIAAVSSYFMMRSVQKGNSHPIAMLSAELCIFIALVMVIQPFERIWIPYVIRTSLAEIPNFIGLCLMASIFPIVLVGLCILLTFIAMRRRTGMHDCKGGGTR